MAIPINNWTALLAIALYAAPFAAFVYRRRYGRYAKYIRAWRRRITTMAEQPFNLRALTPFERNGLIGHDGLTSNEWAHAWAADFIAGRRDHQPTCGEYLHEFGKHPKVRAT